MISISQVLLQLHQPIMTTTSNWGVELSKMETLIGLVKEKMQNMPTKGKVPNYKEMEPNLLLKEGEVLTMSA